MTVTKKLDGFIGRIRKKSRKVNKDSWKYR